MKNFFLFLLLSGMLSKSYSNNTGAPPDTPVPIGTIVACVLDAKNIPPGWLLCDGSPIPENKYSQLRNILGSNTLPNLSGYTLVGAGTPTYNTGVRFSMLSSGGEYQHTLTLDEMPVHDHNLPPVLQLYMTQDCNSGENGAPCKDSRAPTTTENAGGGKPHNNMQPYYVINYIIYAGNG